MASRQLREDDGAGPGKRGYDLRIASWRGEPCKATEGPIWVSDERLESLDADPDVLIVPGGLGVRRLVDDATGFLRALGSACERSRIVASVCTGSALLARAGVLRGRRATSNKRSWAWVTRDAASPALTGVREWLPRARWVVDGNVWTSSGVAAGCDMALAMVERDFGIANVVAKRAEYVWNFDPDNDPFEAKL